MFTEIRTNQDIQDFLEKCNCLHDGYIIDVYYINQGISKIENGHYFEPDKTKLILQILVTSICDTIIEIEFENLLEVDKWENYHDYLDNTTVMNIDGNEYKIKLFVQAALEDI